MRNHLVLSGIVFCAGCAQLAGIDETSGDGLDRVSLAFERISVGSTVERAPQDLTGFTATYRVPDGEPVVAEQIAVDTWSADIFEPTPVVFDLGGTDQRLFDFPNTGLLGGVVVLEHPGAAVVSPDSLLTVNVTLEAPYNSESLQLFTVGSWNVRGLEPPVLGALAVTPPAFAMSTMASLSGRPHERITSVDTINVLRYVGNTLTGVAPIPAFEQTGNDTLTGTMALVAQDKTLDIRIDPTTAGQRISTCRPALPAVSFAWSLRAAPGPELVDVGPLLNAAAAIPGDAMATAAFGNPFEAIGWPTLLSWNASASRTFAGGPNGLAVTLSAGLFQLEQNPAAGITLDLPAGIPELIRLDGDSLSTDGISITAPVAPITVELELDRDGGTLFQIVLSELAANVDGTAIVRTDVFSATAVTPTFTLPPEAVVAGKTYTLRAITFTGGFPNVAGGDVRARSLPVAVAFLDSGVFTVTP